MKVQITNQGEADVAAIVTDEDNERIESKTPVVVQPGKSETVRVLAPQRIAILEVEE